MHLLFSKVFQQLFNFSVSKLLWILFKVDGSHCKYIEATHKTFLRESNAENKKCLEKESLHITEGKLIKTKLKDVKIKTNSTRSTEEYKNKKRKTRNKMPLRFKKTVTVC